MGRNHPAVHLIPDSIFSSFSFPKNHLVYINVYQFELASTLPLKQHDSSTAPGCMGSVLTERKLLCCYHTSIIRNFLTTKFFLFNIIQLAHTCIPSLHVPTKVGPFKCMNALLVLKTNAPYFWDHSLFLETNFPVGALHIDKLMLLCWVVESTPLCQHCSHGTCWNGPGTCWGICTEPRSFKFWGAQAHVVSCSGRTQLRSADSRPLH